MMRRIVRRSVVMLTGVFLATAAGTAHSGPPFPIVSNHLVGAYQLSVWTDPDTTDDGSAGGQFWVTIHAARAEATVAPETRATVSVSPLHGTQSEQTVIAAPVRRDVSSQFAALVLDHEGRFRVRVVVAGPLGTAEVE
ncbi:MAG: hypothetical protein HQ485_15945, partial [Acidobacteria bacterium]|nr:hypothetical protein [Acidobacteriota bacterium]